MPDTAEKNINLFGSYRHMVTGVIWELPRAAER